MENVEATGRIRITKIPAGEAPLEIRKAWVGLVLPCHPYLGFPDSAPDRGVLTGQSASCDSCGSYGVSVPQDQAIDILAQFHPEAAAWWRQHGYPNPAPDDLFGFENDVIEIVSGVKHQQIIHVPEEAMGQPDR